MPGPPLTDSAPRRGSTRKEDLNKYVVFVVEDEPAWEAKTEAERQLTWDADHRFGQALERRGGRVVGGAGLAHTSSLAGLGEPQTG